MELSYIHRECYDFLADLFGGDLQNLPDCAKANASPFMPLSFDVIEPGDRPVVSLQHYFTMNGDLVPDPDMTMRIDYEKRYVEALTYQDLTRFDEVYDGERRNARQYQSQNSFLRTWLRNLKSQGFRFRNNS